MRQTSFFLSVCFSLLVGLSLTGCTDKDSSLGVGYFPDTLQFKTVTRNDTSLLKLSSLVKTTITVTSGHHYSLNWASPLMFVGKVAQPTENFEAWSVLQFPVLGGDTLRRVTAVKLILQTIGFRYGDTSNTNIDFQVYGEGGGKTTDSTLHLAKSDLTPAPYGRFTQSILDSTKNTVSVAIDTSIKIQLSAASFAFVLVPGTMTNVRAFGTSESADAAERPILQYTVKVDTGIITINLNPTLDMHILNDVNTPTPAHEFSLRGGFGERESVFLNLNLPADTVQLNQFSTINNAELVLKLDPANSRHSNLAFDTLGPVVAQVISANDSNATYYANGTHDSKDPTLIRFQMRTLLEYWLRNPTNNFGIELRSGLSLRNFGGSNFTVEDNTLNRWTFFGQDATDPAARPKLVLSYSKLK